MPDTGPKPEGCRSTIYSVNPLKIGSMLCGRLVGAGCEFVAGDTVRPELEGERLAANV